MTGEGLPAGPVPAKAPDLLALAASRPQEALAQARTVLASGPGPYDASVARQAVGIVLRDFGNLDAALRELRAARRLGKASGSADREADALASLGIALVFAGRSVSGLAALDTAAGQASSQLAGRVRMRRGSILLVLGRHAEALDDLRYAVHALRRAGDTIWEARALTSRGLVHLTFGATERAHGDLARAEHLLRAAGQEYESAVATHNRGLVAFRAGDLPAALAHLDQAARRYESLATPVPDLSLDRCAVLLAAGLPADALAEIDGAVRDLDRTRGQPTKKAELLLAAAGAALAAADPATATERAQAAQRLFRAQRRTWWRAHASFLVAHARYVGGAASGRLLRQAEQTAAELAGLGAPEASRAHLLAGRVALALGRHQTADRHLAAAAKARHRGPALWRVTAWLAEALRAEAAGDGRRVLHACRQGLDVLDTHLLTLGASELRAQATAQGAELAALAQRRALQAGDARRLLVWSERWRAAALAVPPVRPADDRELRAELTAMRDVVSRLDRARAEGVAGSGALQREQQRREAAVRALVLRARGAGLAGAARFQPAELLAELGDTRLVEIVDVDGVLHVLVCGPAGVRRFAGGRTAAVARELDFVRFGLSRLARAPAADRTGPALGLLGTIGSRLEEALLGTARGHLGDGPLVVVPPGRLHAVPWAVLPELRDRAVSVAPSARLWLRARRAVPPPHRDVALVVGPDLGTGSAELPALAKEYERATVLGDGTATTDRVLAAIDGTWLAHIAAHGTFRADSPMFSSLRMDDGPLTVHDLERLRRAPHRLILSSCDSGLLAPAGADELLGLASSLVPLGTVGIIASVVPVNDAAVVPLMQAVHGRLHQGATLAEALRAGRAALGGEDPVLTATGWSFVALGAG